LHVNYIVKRLPFLTAALLALVLTISYFSVFLLGETVLTQLGKIQLEQASTLPLLLLLQYT